MERNSYNGDFERFLRDNANGYRMYPSEKVWKGVHRSLHVRSKWYRLSALLLLFSFLTTGMILIFSLKKADNNSLASATTANGKSVTNEQPAGTPASDVTRQQITTTQDILTRQPVFVQSNKHSTNKEQTPVNTGAVSAALNQLIAATPESIAPSVAIAERGDNSFAQEMQPEEPLFQLSGQQNDPASAYRASLIKPNPNKLATANTISVSNPALPFLRPDRRKLSWQVHFAPTVSYRKLSENKQYRPVGSVNYTSLLNVNEAVSHKPDLGFEIGIDARYSLSDKIRARIGIQSNVTRYEIRAYSSRTELATITLNSQSGPPNSVSAISNYRNFGGANSNWLENLYLQVSIPFGIDYIIADNKKTQFGISSSLQPTYLLGKNAYLLSADYKNYVKVPELVRRWNANVDFETFIAYSTGKIKWQVGPQVRYQVFSSFVDTYPVRENLFDFGLKLGMSLNKR